MGPVLPGGDMAIEVFDLPENDDMFSPSDVDTSKLAHKFKEVSYISENTPWTQFLVISVLGFSPLESWSSFLYA